MDEIQVKTYQDVMGDTTIIAKIPSITCVMDTFMAQDLLHEIVRQAAQKYVEEHYVELVSKLDQQAALCLFFVFV